MNMMVELVEEFLQDIKSFEFEDNCNITCLKAKLEKWKDENEKHKEKYKNKEFDPMEITPHPFVDDLEKFIQILEILRKSD
jgi:hypothetical protein